MQTIKNQALIAFRQELQSIWAKNRYLGRAEILTKIRHSLYNHDKRKAADLDNQTVVASELLQATITENLRLLIESVGTSAQVVHFEHFTPPYFEGREQDFEEVHTKLFRGENLIMLVNGQGGMGKSSFAAKYWERYECQYQFLASVVVSSSITDALLRLAKPLNLEFEPTMPNDERLKILVQHIQHLDKPCLLFLDNVDKEDELRTHYGYLYLCKNFHILITSRLADFSYVAKHPINALPLEVALRVFKYHYPKFDEQEIPLFEQVYREVEGNTLVLELFAKNLHYFHQIRKNYSLNALVEDIKKGLTKLDKQEKVEIVYARTGFGITFDTPKNIILAMYDLTELTETEKALLSVFSVLPAENIEYEILEKMLKGNPQTLQYAEALRNKIQELGSIEALKMFSKNNGFNLSNEEIDKYLNPKVGNFENLDGTLLSLTKKGWIEKNETAFKISNVVQEIVRIKNQERLWGDCEKMIDFLIEESHPENFNYHHENYKYTAIYSGYAENIGSIFQNNTYEIALLFERVAYFYKMIGNSDKSLKIFGKAHQIYQNRFNENPKDAQIQNNLAVSCEKLGVTHSILGNLVKALTFFEKGSKLGEELTRNFPSNKNFKNSLAISYEKLGETYSSIGNSDKALEFFEKDMQLTKELHHDFPSNVNFKNGLAISYEKLGEIYLSMQNLDKALEFFEKRNKLGKELTRDFPSNVDFKNGLAISYEKLGKTHFYIENLDKALNFFERYMQLSEELHYDFPSNVDFKNLLAISYQHLGRTHSSMWNLDKALTFFEKYNQFERELHNDFPNNIEFKNLLAISYAQLYQVYLKMDKKIQAKEYLLQAISLFEELKNDFPYYAQFTEYWRMAKTELEANF